MIQKYLRFFGLFPALFLLTSCFIDPPEEGTITIQLAPRAGTQQTEPVDLRYTIVLTGPGGAISESIVNPKTSFSRDFSLASGTWEVTVTAYSTGETPAVRGKGTETVSLRAGETARTLIHMRTPSDIGISLDGFIEGLPETITLSKTGTDFPLRMRLKVAGDTVYDTYEWYLNENPVPVAATSDYTLEAASCRLDKNVLTVEVVKDFMFYSKTISFTVIP